MVDHKGSGPSYEHIKCSRKLTEPASGDKMMRFLTLVSCFAAFVNHSTKIAAQLYKVVKRTEFTKKRRHGKRLATPDWSQRWETLQSKARQELKDVLSGPTMLTASIRGMPRKVMTNASAHGLNGVLLQIDQKID